MIKTLARSIKQEKENFRIPHSLQDVIPIRRIWPDGIFRTGKAIKIPVSTNDKQLINNVLFRLLLQVLMH